MSTSSNDPSVVSMSDENGHNGPWAWQQGDAHANGLSSEVEEDTDEEDNDRLVLASMWGWFCV